MYLSHTDVSLPFFLPPFLSLKVNKYFFHLLILESGRDIDLVASYMSPTRDLACNPGMCPDWELNQLPFPRLALHPLSHTSQGIYLLLKDTILNAMQRTKWGKNREERPIKVILQQSKQETMNYDCGRRNEKNGRERHILTHVLAQQVEHGKGGNRV